MVDNVRKQYRRRYKRGGPYRAGRIKGSNGERQI